MQTLSNIPGLVLVEHLFELPLDYSYPSGETIEVFARECVDPEKVNDDLPWLLFLQGGPGFGAPRPTGRTGWLKRALKEFRVLLLDQRGTGNSTPVHAQRLRGMSPQEQAEYLSLMRADNIVRDAEAIRKKLIGDTPWAVLGQSFGGFCALHYLSAAPEGLSACYFTGGLPSIWRNIDEVYDKTYATCVKKNDAYYARYPQDIELVHDIVDYLATHEVRLPDGDLMTVRRFQQLGMGFGATDGYERTHYALEGAFVQGPDVIELSYGFLADCNDMSQFDTNPIYAILHEAIYCQGFASKWSAERVRAKYPQFDDYSGNHVLFTGEMIYPWMFDDMAELAPLKQAAEILAAKEDWPSLYDADTLAQNTVPCAAAIYFNDLYVPVEFSLETASAIPNLYPWVTSEYEHNALRADGEHVLDRLIGMTRGQVYC